LAIPIVIFARMSSSRLPGKALRPIAGRPMLARVVERCAAAALASGVVVATSVQPDDDAVTALARELGVPAFRGALDDVAGRALACAEAGGHRDFVRISGDSPFIDATVIDRAIDLHRRDGADLTSNTHPREYPPGMSVEVIHTAALRRALAKTSDAEDREHVTPYFYKHRDRFRISHLVAERPWPEGVRLTVDDAGELEQADWIARRLPEPFAQVPGALIVDLASQFAMESAQ
jgi:spore coat polysaccharide biosynthesis protein SpsF